MLLKAVTTTVTTVALGFAWNEHGALYVFLFSVAFTVPSGIWSLTSGPKARLARGRLRAAGAFGHWDQGS